MCLMAKGVSIPEKQDMDVFLKKSWKKRMADTGKLLFFCVGKAIIFGNEKIPAVVNRPVVEP